MANGKIRFGKQSGGQLALIIPDGVTSTDVVVPESGVLATQAYADGKTTLAQVKDEIRTGSNLVTSSTGAVGYGAGSGGTVTQLTSKSTSVTLNKPSGQIITSSSALGAGVTTAFILNNTLLTGNDNIKVIVGGTEAAGAYQADCTYCVNGVANITIKNLDSISRTDAVAINFTIIKGANS